MSEDCVKARVTKLPFAERAGTDAAIESTLNKISFESEHFFEDYVLDLTYSRNISETDAEKIIRNAFCHARNNASQYTKEIPIQDFLDAYIFKSMEEHEISSRQPEHERDDQRIEEESREQVAEEIRRATEQIMRKRGCSYAQARAYIKEHVLSIHRDDPTICQTSKISPEKRALYQREFDELVRPKAPVIDIKSALET